VANDHIDLTVEPGEIRALLGENGAGKTPLMNVLYGLVQPDEGEIRVDGKAVVIRSPKDAIAAKIGMVHQHFMLVPVFTVAENVTWAWSAPGRSACSTGGGPAGMSGSLRALRPGRRPRCVRRGSPVGVQQRVEIIKALLREASVLVLDEPTSVLTPGETEDLFRIMRELRAGGRSIVFISHKLREVQAIADTITVIRRGKVVGERPPTATDAELAALMVGRAVQLRVSKTPASPARWCSSAATSRWPANTEAGRGRRLLRSPGGRDPRRGRRAGQRADRACEALMGLRPAAAGSVLIDGRDVSTMAPRERLRAGIGYIPEDRQEDGLVGDFSVADNLVLDVYDRKPFASGIALNLNAIEENAVSRVEEFDVRTSSVATPTRTLSGGNQQKVIVAREVSRDIRVLLASQPTRGLDVGSIEFVHRRIVEQRDRGWPWSSCRRNSTRSTPSPTASRSCTRARSPASARRRSPPTNSGC
jgi:simple sugar transport system ATP-binding protein